MAPTRDGVTDGSMTRREWLARGAGALVAAGAATAGGFLRHDRNGRGVFGRQERPLRRLRNYFATVDFPASNPRISVATGGGDDIDRLVRAAVNGLVPHGGMRLFVSAGDVVLIKPNVGFDRPPHLGATTHPEVVRVVIRMCHEAGAARVIVADHPIEAPAVCFARSGIGSVAREEGAQVMFPHRSSFERVLFRDRRADPRRGEVLDVWPIFYRPLAEAGKVIGIAPIKDHNLCGASMNLKNWYGTLGGPRNEFHRAIHAIVSDLALVFSPTLVIADATRVMVRSGPTGGRISDVVAGGKVGRPTVVASVDPVACDAWCHENLLGRDPGELSYLQLAEAKIQADRRAGATRFGQRDWRAYDLQGKIVTQVL